MHRIGLIFIIFIQISLISCATGPFKPFTLSTTSIEKESDDSVIIDGTDVNHQRQELRHVNSSVECYTNKREAGECKPFLECFPLLDNELNYINISNVNTSKNHESHARLSLQTFSWTPLQDEIFNNTKVAVCTSKEEFVEDSRPVCCEFTKDATLAPLQDPPTGQEQDVSPEVKESDENILALNCGKTATSIRQKSDHSKIQKITGGRDTLPGQFPFMVAIFGKNGKHSCGASLISNDYILTASHCLFTYNAKDISQLRIHLGDYNIQTLSDMRHETRRVSKIILHKGFNTKTYFNDIALMKLDSPVNFTDKIQPICLSSKETKDIEGSNAVVMGWGRSRAWGQASAVLKAVEIPIWKYDACHRVFATFAPGRLMESNVCAGDGKKNKDACIGDSGGPLVRHDGSRWTQIGIVSWGKGCGSFPGVYTSTQSYLTWINKNLRN